MKLTVNMLWKVQDTKKDKLLKIKNPEESPHACFLMMPVPFSCCDVHSTKPPSLWVCLVFYVESVSIDSRLSRVRFSACNPRPLDSNIASSKHLAQRNWDRTGNWIFCFHKPLLSICNVSNIVLVMGTQRRKMVPTFQGFPSSWSKK